ncbi:MAG TPA: gas vesicle protein K [Deltaproteobacteria bacterium]|nr:gas vesicle protein K [Deltaproteobacteria bacterium]
MEADLSNPRPSLSACLPAQSGPAQAGRLNLEPEKVEQGLARLVLSLIELLRQLMERQAIRRMEGGSLSPDEIERLGTTLMKLEKRMEELKEHFGIDDLNLDLGPLGKLID